MEERKQIPELGVGDWVTRNTMLAVITRVLSDRLEITITHIDGTVSETRTISRRTGKEFGCPGYWSTVNATGSKEEADLLFEQFQREEKKRQQVYEERKAERIARLQSIRDANPELTVTTLFQDLQKAIFRNRLGREGLLLFCVERRDYYGAGFQRISNGFHLTSIHAYVDEGCVGTEQYSSHSLSSSDSFATLEDAIYDVIYLLWN